MAIRISVGFSGLKRTTRNGCSATAAAQSSRYAPGRTGPFDLTVRAVHRV